MAAPTSLSPATGKHAGDPDPLAALRALEAWGWARSWRGSDPYDGLNATRLATPLKRHRRGRQALIQLVKRSPVDLRRPLGIRPADDAAALAWVLSAYCRAEIVERSVQDERIGTLLERLLELRSPGYDEPCWGYHFDMQSRVFFYPAGSPNVIATTFAGAALIDLHERTGAPELLELVHGIGRFLVANVPQTEDAPGAFFGYLVDDRSPIHNSNLHVCAFLARAAGLVDEPGWRERAARGVQWSVERQLPSGAFPYGERPNLQWVDGFHTGYVLDALQVCRRAGVEAASEDASRRGIEYWRDNLFDPDGAARYFDTSRHPIDAQCVAQGLQTFSAAAGEDPAHLESARRVFGYAQRCMRRRDGAYVFQRRKAWVNRVPHMRGANAEMMLGLAMLVSAGAS